MNNEEPFDDLKTWLDRAVVLLRQESKLRWQVVATGIFVPAFVTVLHVLETSLLLEHVLSGLGGGVFLGVALIFMFLDNRMEAVFPEYGDNETDVDAEDSLRAQYVRGDIDHETFQRRLDEKLSEPAGRERSGGDSTERSLDGQDEVDPIGLLQARYARGELDDEEYRHRLKTLQETDETTDEQLTERN